MPDLEKTYSPQAIEPRWAQAWVDGQVFRARNADQDARARWSLVIPPPNVTGSLHMGHMLEHTLIDIIVRWRRMQGLNVLWLPGTDHAGIATQMVVERDLAAQGHDRQAMGREAFLQAVWAWKRNSGDRIVQQMIRLGASCDWSRARFTMDDGLSRAVREVFVRLYEEGLIYRGRYIVNWCPRCQTAVSDLEVTHEAAQGKLYTLRYRGEREGEEILVATTRPETVLADVAVAVNPADARYTALLGRRVRVPLTERWVPVIADEIAQPEFGTGAVKITPGHDPNDFAAGQRHNLPQLEVINARGQMEGASAGAYAGLDRFDARKRMVADLEAEGLLAATADHALSLGKCQRCATVIEPRISAQWFVKIAPLAQAAVAAVERGEIRFTPASSQRNYFDWMANIHDWCISRQLWWGHRIPAWHCPQCGRILVAREAPAACPCGGALEQDPDVLDTWFSSGLWPFSTLGWPEQTADLRDFYPTSLLITGFDILFFWVARMIMLGLRFTGEVPFREVYIHALVRDAERQKMSKTKGNVIDPLVVTERYGTDAVRFTLASMAAPGTDIALAEERMQGYAAFANKIWNAARFLFMNVGEARPSAAGALEGDAAIDRWIFSRLSALAEEMNQQLGACRFDLASSAVYHFFWDEFCDWYLELHKRRPEEQQAAGARNLLAAFERALRILHPFMPFITEELWHALYAGRPPLASLALAQFPPAGARDPEAEQQIGLLQELVVQIRSLRAQWRIAPSQKLPARILLREIEPGNFARVGAAVRELAGLAALEAVTALGARRPGYLATQAFEVQLDLEDLVDWEAERARQTRERDGLAQRLANARAKLSSEGFRRRAQPAVLAETERLASELEQQVAEAERTLATLG